jgi:predicted DNA binding protein
MILRNENRQPALYTEQPNTGRNRLLRQVALELGMENEMQRVASENAVKLAIRDCRDFNSKGMTMLLELEGSNEGITHVVRELRRLDGMRHVYDSDVSATKTICLAVMDRPLLCSESMNSGIICLQCPYNSGAERCSWQLLVKRSDDLRELITNLERHGVKVQVSSVSEVDQEGELTGHQKEILAKAISLGYFDFPRKVSLTSLSQIVGVKPSTLSEILRSAERKIMCGALQGALST